MLLQPLEALLNRNVAASSAARSLCRKLDRKVLALQVTGVPLNLYLCAEGERIKLNSSNPGAVDATLSGSPLSFLRMAGPQPEAALRSGAVHIQGDAEVAQAFSELLIAAQPDLEEELAQVIGDVPAHQIGNLVRGTLRFGRHAADTMAQNVAEFLQEERRDLPSRTEAEEYLTEVDRLRDDVERLEARLALLERKPK